MNMCSSCGEEINIQQHIADGRCWHCITIESLDYRLAEKEAELQEFKAATFQVTTQATLDHIIERLTI